MKILQSHKIGGEIIDIIFEAKEFIIIVSPYVNFKYWNKIVDEITAAKKRGVRIDFFVKNEPDNFKSWEEVERLDLKPRLVNNLHAKFYMNEKMGVISSMNLLSSSNHSSIEIGCKLETADELSELKNFVKSSIIPNEVKEKPSDDDLYLTKEKFSVVLENYISHNFQSSKIGVYFSNGVLKINSGSNQYFLSFDKVKNTVFISGILSGLEAENFEMFKNKYFESTIFECLLILGDKGSYNQVGAISKSKFSTTQFDSLRINEKKLIIPEITNFIYRVECFKEDIYESKKGVVKL